jgi:phage tail-like protein
MRSQPFLKPAFGWFVLTAVAALVAAEILAGTGGEDRTDVRPSSLRARSPRFTVSLQLEEAGISGVFTEVSGLDSENEVLEFRDGNDPNVTHKVPGQLKYPNLVLKRGVTGDASLWQWRRLVETGNIADARSNGTLVLLDRGNPVATWRFVNAWPAKITGPELCGKGNEVAIEAVTIVHEGFVRN